MALSFLCFEMFRCECILREKKKTSQQVIACIQIKYVTCLYMWHVSNQTTTAIVRILHLVCCVHGGLNGGAHAFLDCGCQVVELMVLVDLKHPQHPPSPPPLPPASPPGLTGGARDSLTCHFWQLAEERVVLKDWSSATVDVTNSG